MNENDSVSVLFFQDQTLDDFFYNCLGDCVIIIRWYCLSIQPLVYSVLGMYYSTYFMGDQRTQVDEFKHVSYHIEIDNTFWGPWPKNAFCALLAQKALISYQNSFRFCSAQKEHNSRISCTYILRVYTLNFLLGI